MLRSPREQFLAVVVVASVAALVTYFVMEKRTDARQTVAPSTTPATTLPAGHTEHDYRKALLEFNRRTLVDAYRAVGHRDKRWDANAIIFLEAMALYFSYSGADRHYAVPAAPTIDQLIRLSDAAILDTGCDDPLLAYCYAALLHDTMRIDTAEPVLAKWAERLQRSAYPPHRIQAAWGRLHRLRREYRTGAAGAPAALEKAYDAIVAVVTQEDFTGIDRRIHFDHIKDVLKAGSINRQEDLIERLRDDRRADPWLFNMLAGNYRINAAWSARGRGTFDTVSRSGWESFENHLRAARTHLVAAWDRDPTAPEPAALLITVAMGAGDVLHESPRTWFDRAVSAQIDYQPAYANYLWNLRPRWGGSHEQMYAFGLECLKSDRYDTRVPIQFVYAMERIGDDLGGGAYWRRPGAYDHAAEFFQRQRDAAPDADDRRWYSAYQAALAWQNQRMNEARRLLDDAGDEPPNAGFDAMNVIGPLAMSHAYAITGPHSATIVRAEGLLEVDNAGSVDEAATLYRDLASKVAPADRGSAFIRGRAAELAWRRTFNAGEWVDVQPDAQLTGWWSLGGQWRVDEQGRLTGAFSEANQRLICQAGFIGDNYELAGVLEFPTDKTAAPLAGPIFAHTSAYYSFGVFMHRREGAVGINAGVSRMDHKPVSDLPDRCEFLVRVRGGLVTAEVNGEPVYRDHDLRNNLSVASRRFIGVSGFNSRAQSVRFSKLRIRDLDSGAVRERRPPELTPESIEPPRGLLLSRAE
jgi:hypothetical protein